MGASPLKYRFIFEPPAQPCVLCIVFMVCDVVYMCIWVYMLCVVVVVDVGPCTWVQSIMCYY